MKKIDFFKKGYIDFFLNYFIAFSKVQSDIFTDKSHSTLKRNPKVSLEGRVHVFQNELTWACALLQLHRKRSASVEGAFGITVVEDVVAAAGQRI